MREPVGIFTLTWRLVKQVPKIIRYLWDIFGPLLGKGSILGQVIYLIFVIKILVPVAFWLVDNIPIAIKWILDNFEK